MSKVCLCLRQNRTGRLSRVELPLKRKLPVSVFSFWKVPYSSVYTQQPVLCSQVRLSLNSDIYVVDRSDYHFIKLILKNMYCRSFKNYIEVYILMQAHLLIRLTRNQANKVRRYVHCNIYQRPTSNYLGNPSLQHIPGG